MNGNTENATSCQAPVHPQQHDHDPQQRDQVTEDRDHAGGEEIVQCIDVGRHARHQATHRVAVVEPDVEPLQMRVDLHAEVKHDPLPHHLHRVRLDVFEDERPDEEHEKQQATWSSPDRSPVRM